MKRRDLLFLIGYRGSGKTTTARLLADRLGWAWLDADAVLEARANRSIRQIFLNEGETSFRDQEAAILRELCKLMDHVIATGGGVILREENRTCLKQGTVIWLQAEADVLWNRLQTDAVSREQRPNLAQGGLAEIQELLKVRTPLYEACSDYTVDASQTPEQIADAIVSWLREPLGS